jgi:hypothetical protein
MLLKKSITGNLLAGKKHCKIIRNIGHSARNAEELIAMLHSLSGNSLVGIKFSQGTKKGKKKIPRRNPGNLQY